MGNPDLPAPAHVLEKLKETIGKPRTDRYSASKRHRRLRRAQAAYYAAASASNSIRTPRSSPRSVQEGFANVAQAITAPATSSGAQSELPDPRLRFPDGRRRHPSIRPSPVPHSSRRSSSACKHSIPKPLRSSSAIRPNPNRLYRRSRFYREIVAAAKTHNSDRPVRSRLCGSLFRRQPAAVSAAGAGGDGHRRRIHLDVEDLFDAGLAHGIRGRQ